MFPKGVILKRENSTTLRNWRRRHQERQRLKRLRRSRSEWKSTRARGNYWYYSIFFAKAHGFLSPPPVFKEYMQCSRIVPNKAKIATPRSRSIWGALFHPPCFTSGSMTLVMPQSHQTFRPVPTAKLLGIMFRIRCWPIIFHTITVGYANGWC